VDWNHDSKKANTRFCRYEPAALLRHRSVQDVTRSCISVYVLILSYVRITIQVRTHLQEGKQIYLFVLHNKRNVRVKTKAIHFYTYSGLCSFPSIALRAA
jgi:hypothetical protein